MKNIGKPLFILLNTLFFASFTYAQPTFIDSGTASYYANKFHGKKTASGEKYDMNKLTAAHPSLPFNTIVKVTNLKNNKSVIVRINDRGPFTKNRIIDLSKAAASKIGMIQAGTAHVRIEELKNQNTKAVSNNSPSSSPNELKNGKIYSPDQKEVALKGYTIQSSSFSNLQKTSIQIEKLKKAGFKELYIEPATVKNKKVYRILIGSFESKEKASANLKVLKKKGYTGFVKSIN